MADIIRGRRGGDAEKLRLVDQRDESVAPLDALWDSAPIGLGYVNRELRFVRVNEAFALIDGIPIEAHIGRSPEDVAPAIFPRMVEQLHRVLETGQPIIDAEVVGEHGCRLTSYYPVELGGKMLGVGLVMRDITRYTQAKQTLETERSRLLAQAEEAVRARDVFLAVAAHELRTPLTPLKINLQLLQRELAARSNEERLSGRVEVALRQIDRLSHLVENLLDITRGTMGWRLPIERREVDVAELAREVAAQFEGEAARARCALELRLDSPAPAWVDPARVKLVFASLLSNAIKYGAGKPVVVSVERRPDLVRFAVQDRGIGIAPEERGRLFGLFGRAVSERRYGGLGIGLYIAKQIVDAHGGRITWSSELGAGARFEVELPTEPSADPGAASPAEPFDPGHQDV